MDSNDNAEMNTTNIVKDESSNNPSPKPESLSSTSSTSSNIRINSILRVKTMFDAIRIGKVVAYDPVGNLVTLHTRGSKPGLITVSIINLNHCREYIVEQEPKEDSLESLYPIDINKLKRRQAENEAEKRKEASFINTKASRIGQALFRDIKKTMNQVIRWSNNDIIINNTVRIVEPYRPDNVSIDISSQATNGTNSKTSAKSENDTKVHIMKLVERFWSDQSKITSLMEPNSTKSTIDTNGSTSSTC